VNLLTQGQLDAPRVNQFDMRFAKVIKFLGGRRADIGIDLYDIFNSADQTTFQEAYDFATNGSTYMRPTAIISPRFARFNLTFNF
jgi:hypothetical protein